MQIEPVAHIESAFREKFGIPRQSRLAPECPATIVLEPQFRSEDSVRALESFSHIWLIWGFSAAKWDGNLTVRPPRLGGNTRIGVFASRSPFRPNSLGMSAVRLESIEFSADRGPLLHVLGADLLDGTPIYDIKPYVPYADRIDQAQDGYTAPTKAHRLKVNTAPGADAGIDAGELAQIVSLIELDPRVAYDCDPKKVWGMAYGGLNVRFRIAGDTATILSIEHQLKR